MEDGAVIDTVKKSLLSWQALFVESSEAGNALVNFGSLLVGIVVEIMLWRLATVLIQPIQYCY